jgi:hypothetical protein
MDSQSTTVQLTPAAVLSELIWGYRKTQALHVAAKLAICDVRRDGPQTVGEIAAAVGAHEPSLHRLLRALTLVGVLTESVIDNWGDAEARQILRNCRAGGLSIIEGLPA